MLTTLIFSLTLGAISSVNPCGFALLPAYFAHRLGVNTTSELDRGLALGLALNAGGAATAGFVVVFGVIGAVISFGAYWLGDILPWAGFAIGILLVIIGVLVLLGKHFGVRLPKIKSLTKQHGLKGDFLFGVGYGTASLSCTLPIFLSVTGVAISGGLLGSFLNFVAFGIGMGTVLIAIAIAAALSQNGLARAFKMFLPHAHSFSAVILILAGAYVTYYWGSLLLSSEIPGLTGVVGIGEYISSTLRRLLGSGIGQAVIMAMTATLFLLSVWTFWRKRQAVRFTKVRGSGSDE